MSWKAAPVSSRKSSGKAGSKNWKRDLRFEVITFHAFNEDEKHRAEDCEVGGAFAEPPTGTLAWWAVEVSCAISSLNSRAIREPPPLA